MSDSSDVPWGIPTQINTWFIFKNCQSTEQECIAFVEFRLDFMLHKFDTISCLGSPVNYNVLVKDLTRYQITTIIAVWVPLTWTQQFTDGHLNWSGDWMTKNPSGEKFRRILRNLRLNGESINREQFGTNNTDRVTYHIRTPLCRILIVFNGCPSIPI